jgi:type II secretory pathway component PulJ
MHKKRRDGFLLLMVIVYLGLCSMLSFILFRFMTDIHRKCTEAYRESSQLIARTLPFDLLRRDLQSAHISVNSWNEEAMLFKRDFVDSRGNIVSRAVGWQVANERLWRVEGDYDFLQKIWRKKSKTLLCKRVQHAEWKIFRNQKGDLVKHIEIELEHHGKVQRDVVRLRRREWRL